MRVAGIMSGTSLDGIDVAVVDIQGAKIATAAHATTSYPPALRRELLAVSNAMVHVSAISRLSFRLARVYAAALKKCGIPLESIELIGCHGQTIFHERASTLQLGDGSVLAELTGIPVVSDFRTRDIAAGGHGAPLVPFVDYKLFRHRTRNRIALNIGGIANITILPASCQPEQVIAFDTGPGNMLIDALVEHHTNGRQRYDAGGKLASKGKLHRDLLDQWLKDRYYSRRPPKTAGREQYGKEFIAGLLKTGLPVIDLIATATAFTAATIALGVKRFARFEDCDLIAAGGGTHNRHLMALLQGFLPKAVISTTTEHGVDADAKEAVAFAILAHETWHRRPSNLPSATGASAPVILGKVSFAPRLVQQAGALAVRTIKQEAAMDVTLPADLRKQVEQELASGRYQSSDELIERAVRHFLDEPQRGQRRLDALRRVGPAVDQAGLYERVLVSGGE